MVDQRVVEWKAKFSKLQGGKEIVSLTGEMGTDLHFLKKGVVIMCMPMQVRNSYADSFDIVLIALP